MRQRGFTLIEMLLSVAIIAMLAGVSGPVYNSFVTRNDLDITGQQIVQSLRRAQTYARSMSDDSAWSVEIETSAATLFKGTNFGGRDATLDEAVTIPASITRSGLTEVQFAKFTGLPNTTGTITLTSNTNETRTITINAKGMVNY
jgi:prepilin-type N-terminal cleavage/methylation domain-containing protein